MDLEQRLAEAREKDGHTWAALLEHGMVAGSELTVDSFFVAGGQEQADALAEALGNAGGATSVAPYRERTGLFRRTTRWSVRSSLAIPTATLATVADHSEQMIRLAAERGAEYDGWGAQVPGP